MKHFKIVVLLLLFSGLYLNGQAQTAPGFAFDYDADGNMTRRYLVVITDGLRSADSEKEENLSVVEKEHKITIYPNPTSGNITVGITSLDDEKHNFLYLYDVMGKLIETIEIKSELTPVEIKGPSGIYLLNIYLGDSVSKWKIIKE